MVSSKAKPSVTVVCDAEKLERLPDDFATKRRGAYSASSSKHGKATTFGVRSTNPDESTAKSTKEELKGLMKSIKQFNTDAQFGKERRKSAQDKLTELGAMPLKQQKMPLKMRLAIQGSREKKNKRREEVERVSGVVNSETLKKIKERKANRKKK